MRKILIALIFGFFVLGLFGGKSWAATTQYTVTWGAIPNSNLAGYQVLWGIKSGVYSNNARVGNVTQTSINVYAGAKYYIAVRGIDKQGRMGELSREICTPLQTTRNRRRGSRAVAAPDAIYLPSLKDNELFRTNLGINNPTNATANVDMALVDRDGIIQGVKSIEVPVGGMVQINRILNDLSEDNAVPIDNGDLILESDQKITAWASEINNQTNDPSLLNSKKSGSIKLLIPSTANTGSWTSSMALQNLGAEDAAISITAYSPTGQVQAVTQNPVVVPSGGFVTYENILSSLGISTGYGPLEITSTNGQPLIATSRVAGKTGAGGFFEAISTEAAATSQVIPYLLENGTVRTNLGINNWSAQMANVTLRFLNKNGMELARISTQVLANGLKQLNADELLQIINQGTSGDVECYVRIDSDQPIVSWASQIDNSTSDPGFSMGRGKGSSHFLVPSAANTASWRSSLVVVNTNSQPAYVDIISRDNNGDVQGRLMGLLIPSGGFFSHDNILAYLGVTNGYGPIEVSTPYASAPLMVTSKINSNDGTSGFFEGQVVE